MSNDKFAYGSRFLYAEDLLHGGEYKTVRVTIAAYHEPGSLTAANGKRIDKPVIAFDGREKMLVIGATNTSMITMVTGEQPGPAWIGKTITIQPRIVDAFGDEVLALRVIPEKGTQIRKGTKKMLGRKAIFNQKGSNE